MTESRLFAPLMSTAFSAATTKAPARRIYGFYVFYRIAECYATLRVFMEKTCKKNFLTILATFGAKISSIGKMTESRLFAPLMSTAFSAAKTKAPVRKIYGFYVFYRIAKCYATLRVFMEKTCKKKSPKKNSPKKMSQKKF
jgi:hypothetical protein